MKTNNIDEMCKEEKSYNEWVNNNLHYIRNNKDCIKVMQKMYMDGFAAGFIHRDRVNAMEQLQK